MSQKVVSSQVDWGWRKLFASMAAIGIVVLVAYFLAYRLSFVGDDWIFYEIAGRLSWQEYLIKYIDPRLQTAWYRPLQGILFRLAYDMFGTDQVGYHLGNVLFHLANSLLLFLILKQVTKKWSVGLIAALFYATFPTAVEGVFKPGVVDPLTTLCFLGTVWFWLRYLLYSKSRDYWLAFVCFVLALSSKEIAVFIPVTLFLIDRCVIRAPISIGKLIQRYWGFGVVILGYIPIEYAVVSRSVFVRREGYAVSLQIISNLLDYLSSLAFPWLLPLPFNYVALAIAVLLLAYGVMVKKVYALLPLVANAILGILPILAFPFVTNRFLYLSLTSTAVLYAFAIDWLKTQVFVGWRIWILEFGVTVIAIAGSFGISEAAIGFAEFARVSRVPFRNVSQAHPTFPPDTLLYFINPPLPGPSLSGMFFWRYGSQVSVRVDDMSSRADLRAHANSLVYIFDEQGKQREVAVQKENKVQSLPSLPISFSAPIRLEGYELVNSSVKSSDELVLFLYWRSQAQLEKDYMVSVQWKDPDGKYISGYDKEPRRGQTPTSAWTSGDLVVDAIQFPVTVKPGIYQLSIGLYDPATAERLRILDSVGQSIGDQIILGPVSVTE